MDEKTPLVGAQSHETSSNAPGAPPPYSVIAESPGDQQRVFSSPAIEPVLPDVAPGSGQRTVHCQVCQRIISLEGRHNQLVVKCQECGEATPVKAAPPGKKYVRCPCNCLLICKSSSARVGCPRDTCKRVITLSQTPSSAPNADMGPGSATTLTSVGVRSVSVHCACCGSPFIVTTQAQSTAARCPHCRNISSVGPRYARRRWILFLILAMISLGLGVGVTVGTLELASKNGGIYVVWVGAYIMAIGFFIRSVLYCCMPISTVEIPTMTA